MLHVAPEKRFMKRFKTVPGLDYLSADLYSELAMVKMDLTDIEWESNCFDVIFCSHVLEHIPDDKKAMSELYRVLKRGGWALFQVPIFGDKTYEDFSITSPEGRLLHFGQEDHVRKYGHDIIDRLRSAGFGAEEIYYQKEFSAKQAERYAFSKHPLLYCLKS